MSHTSVALNDLLDDDWQYWMTSYPELATQFGLPGHNGRWTDYSEDAIASRATHLRATIARLDAIDRSHLSAPDQLTYDLYRDLIVTAIEGLEFGHDAVPIRGVIPHSLQMPMNQLEGIAVDVPMVSSIMPAESAADFEDRIARLAGVPALVDQTIALMTRGLEAGFTTPLVSVGVLPDLIAAAVAGEPLENPMLAPFRSCSPLVTTAERARLQAAAVQAFVTHTRPAFGRLHEFVRHRYLPACRNTTSAAALPRGNALYEYNVRWHTTRSETADEIHAIGLEEVARIGAEMARVRKASGFKGSADDFATFLRTSPQFYFKDAASLLAAYRDLAKRADPALARLFRRLPQTPYGVLAVPEAAAPSQPTAYYQPGSFVAGRAANMFANTHNLESRPRWEMEALTLHEAVPGHHLQISLAQERTELPEFRKHSSYTAYVEGWALYAERLGEEMGFYQDPYAKFGQLTYEMWRAARLVVDTGLHSRNWTRTQAIDFFAAHTPKTLPDITVEVDRYIVWPGQALGYKMGELKIRALRARAQGTLGAGFDVRAFHALLLEEGALPLDVLERRVAAWVASQSAQA